MIPLSNPIQSKIVIEDAVYRTKYRRYAASIINSINSPTARAATIKMVPRSTTS
jgi:hypothetical protein